MARALSPTRQHAHISLHEFEIFLEIAKTQSVRETARRYELEAGQVSRMVKRLEAKLGARLFERTPTGVKLTSQGTQTVRAANAILREAAELGAIAEGGDQDSARIYGLGASSFLCAKLLAPTVATLATNDLALRLRLFEVNPGQIISYALKGAYDLALHIGNLDWPRSWMTTEIGQLRWQLFARKSTSLAKRCTSQQVKKFPFVVPVYWTNEGLTEGNDQCPLKMSARIQGIATSTAEAALGIVRHSEHLAFLPEILAREAVQNGEVVSVEVTDWKTVVKPLFLAVRSDVVPNRLFAELSLLLKKEALKNVKGR